MTERAGVVVFEQSTSTFPLSVPATNLPSVENAARITTHARRMSSERNKLTLGVSAVEFR